MNLASILDGHDAEHTALICRGRSTTYGELRSQIDRVRGGLSSLGVGDGDRVALLCSNSRHFVISYFATLGLGAVAVPLNPLSPAPELEAEIGKVGAKVVIIEKVSTATWNTVDRSAVPAVKTVVTCDPSEAPDDAVSIDDLLEREPMERIDVDPDHLATLIFTSGTAGKPRAAMLTHGNLRANLDQSRTTELHPHSGDVIYSVLPLFHIFGLNVTMSLGLYVGATVVLVQRFDPLTAADTIRDRGVTVLPGAPSMWTAFAHFEELDEATFATVRLALSGASKLPVAVAEKMRDRFGVVIYEGYGLTEAAPTVTSSVGGVAKPGSVGRALEGVQVRLVGESGSDALVGDAGEIWVRGPNVFAGYYQDADVTDAVLTEDGWLKTGDMAVVDDDGYLYLVDRAKDLVIVSGFNVYPAEVESVLTSHPEVTDAAVVGVPHPHTGEAVKAFVVAVPGAEVDEESLIEYTLDHLARYKCPNKVLFVDELPRNTSGKLLRRELVVH
ncbi:MAG: AMP-binding protein [Actinomycetota bacterium]